MSPSVLKSFVASHRTTLVCLLLAAVTAVVYWQVSRFEFTNYDEFIMILQNPFVLGGLTLRGLSWALTTSWFEYWHPLTWLSHMLDCELFGLSTGWHHLVSLGFHVANTLLLFAILQRVTGALWRSAMVAALFALHPLHVESVAWIAERKDVLSAFFFFLTLWAYVRYAESRKHNAECGMQKTEVQIPSSRITHHVSRFTHHASLSSSPRFWFWSAVFMFACGLMCKPMLVTLPFVLLLLDYWPLGRMQNAECRMQNHASRFTFHVSRLTSLPLLVEKLPFFVLTLASCAITYLGVKAGGSILSAEKVPWGLRLANVPVSYVRYLGKLIWPTDLIPLYPMPSHWAGWQVGGAVVVLVLISFMVIRLARTAPYFIVGWLFFLGILVPTIGIVQAGFQSIADRYTYIPSIGIFIAVVWAAADWANSSRFKVRGSRFEVQGSAFGVHSPSPSPTRANEVLPSLEPPIASPSAILPPRGGEGAGSGAGVSPAAPGVSPAVVDGRRGVRPALLAGLAAVVLLLCSYLTWVQLGTWRNSYALWTHCLAVCPDNVIAHYNLGYVLQHSDRTSEAIDQYRAALRLKPDHLDANLNLGIALIGSSRAQEASNYLAAALQIKPDYARAQGAMGLALLELSDYAGAVTHCGEAIRLDPDVFGPYVDIGRALSAQGKSDDALRYYAEALRLNPSFPPTQYYLGLEWRKRGIFDQAAASFGEAVRLAPTWEEARAQLQRALNEANQPQLNTDGHK
jgi:protein O-mannosyl-transferase